MDGARIGFCCTFVSPDWLELDDPRIKRISGSWRGVQPLAHIFRQSRILSDRTRSDVLPGFTALELGGLGASKLRGHSGRMWNNAVNAFVARHLHWTDVPA
jgi:UV DNA damage endonuclease